MLKKIAALSVTAALAFSPLAAMAQTDNTPAAAASPDAGMGPGSPDKGAKPMKHHSHKHMTKMKHHSMKKKKAAADAPAGDAAPAADAPK